MISVVAEMLVAAVARSLFDLDVMFAYGCRAT
jgi:hypothetical protein